MKRGLLLNIAGISLLTENMAAIAACIPTNDCDDLGYKYTSSECSGDRIVCPFDISKYNCANPCDYTETASTCSSRCRDIGTVSCIRNGTTYYKSCGSFGCSDDQTCVDGVCERTPAGSGGSSENDSGDSSGGCTGAAGEKCFMSNCCDSSCGDTTQCLALGFRECSGQYNAGWCRNKGGSPSFYSCMSAGSGKATWLCQF